MPSTSELAIESTLNDLANARLRDRAPGLIDYMVGFQLLDCNDDGTRAVGIFGFEIDQTFYYVPVFFLSGEVQGMDSIYGVDSDLFVPLSEEWINQLINRKAQKLGDPDPSSQGSRGARFPDYRRLSMVPPSRTKMASDCAGPMQNLHPLVDIVPLPEACRTLGLQGFVKQAMDRNPRFADAINRFYTVFDFTDVPRAKRAADKKPLIFVDSISAEGVEDLTDEQRREVLQGGVAVLDTRPEVSKARVWKTQEQITLSSPGTNGLYDLLMADGSIEPAICARLDGTERTMTGDRNDRADNLFIWTKDRWGFVPYRSAHVVRQYLPNEYEKFLTEQGSDPASLKVDDTALFLSWTGEVSLPFTIESILNTEGDLKVYGARGCGSLYCRSSSYSVSKTASVKTAGRHWEASPSMVPQLGLGAADTPGTLRRGTPLDRVDGVIVRPGRVTRLAYSAHKAIISQEGFRAFVVGKEGGVEKSHHLTAQHLGDFDTVKDAIAKVAQDVKVWRSADGLVNVRDYGSARGFTKKAALQHLCGNLGMSAHDAKEILGEARLTPQTYWVKAASELMPFPDVPDRTETGTMSQFHPEVQPTTVQNVRSAPDNSEHYRYNSPYGGGGRAEEGGQFGSSQNPDETLDIAADAAQMGSKEVFDAAALASLIKAARPTDMVEKFLPTMISGMDRVGRLLFLIHWHYDQFEERFDTELPELIDSLRSSFEQLGEIVTKLKQRSISGDSDFFGVKSKTIG